MIPLTLNDFVLSALIYILYVHRYVYICKEKKREVRGAISCFQRAYADIYRQIKAIIFTIGHCQSKGVSSVEFRAVYGTIIH